MSNDLRTAFEQVKPFGFIRKRDGLEYAPVQAVYATQPAPENGDEAVAMYTRDQIEHLLDTVASQQDTKRIDFMQEQVSRGFVQIAFEANGEARFMIDPKGGGRDHAGRRPNSVRDGIDEIMKSMAEASAESWTDGPDAPVAPVGFQQVDIETTTLQDFEAGRRTYMKGLVYAEMPVAESQAAADVLVERARQVSVEGYVHDHDDEHDNFAMTRAAAAYLLHDFGVSALLSGSVPELHQPLWPWNHDEWNPKDRRRNLVRAAALILAEVERMDRGAING